MSLDFSKLSTDDLVALQAGDLSRVSTAGLQHLHESTRADRAASDRAQMAAEYSPTVGMSGPELALAGLGQGMTNLWRGVRQAVTLGGNQADIDEAKRLDAPLLRTKEGMLGSIGGNVVGALPVALIPGVNGYVGSALVGGALGGLQPVASDDGNHARAKNIAIGLAAGPLGTLGARAIGGGINAARALVQPFYQGGREQIAGNALARFADDPSSIAAATSKPTITGARPTLAEQTGDTGIARLQDAVRSFDPQIENAIAGRLAENNAARVGALRSLAGTQADRDAAIAARDAAAAPLYASAKAQTVPVDSTLSALLERPSMQAATGRATKLAAEEGRTFGLTQPMQNPASALLGPNGLPLKPASTSPSTVSGQTLQDLKMGMDALLKDPASGIAGHEARAVGETRNALVQAMEERIPDFKAARTGYAANSKPINALDVGQHIVDSRALSNTSNLAGDPRLQANALLGMLRDEPALMKAATGRKELSALSDALTPEQENLLRTVASEADRAAAVGSAGNGPGSATAQRLASQNVLRALVGPLGTPGGASERWTGALVDSILGRTASSPLNIVYGRVAEPEIQKLLARAVLDPDTARGVLTAAQKAGVRLPPTLLQQLTATSATSGAAESALAANRAP